MKYFLYCRKSTEGDERQALSLPAQERELKELAIKENLRIEHIFKESKSELDNLSPCFKFIFAETFISSSKQSCFSSMPSL